MTIAARTFRVIPKHVYVDIGNLNTRQELNYEQKAYQLPLAFAYRKTTGNDKRVRLLTPVSWYMDIYVIKTVVF